MSQGEENPQNDPWNAQRQGAPGAQPHGPSYGQPPGQPFGQQPFGQPPFGQQNPHQPYEQRPYAAAPFPPPGDPGTLDLPYYGIGFAAAVKRALVKYARFDGRASRSEYWWYALFNVIVLAVLYALAIGLGLATGENVTSAGGELGPAFWPFAVLIMIFLLGSIIPGMSITMRRLHDQDLSGWLLLLAVIPEVGGLVLIILAILPSKPAGARYDRERSWRPVQPQTF
ncbi:MAG: DUF805 domain-containing protein [Microlunatus sp.]|nr:DUF805 domain-containing protein [Microlunatus sp.]